MRLLWLSGWATAFSEFLPELQQALPSCDHHTIDWPELFAAPPAVLEEALASCDAVVAWSQGGQLLLRHLELAPIAAPQQQPLYLVAPATQFCHPTTGWPPALLRGMAGALRRSPQGVLSDFASKLDASESHRRRWLQRALAMEPELLARGLLELQKPQEIASALHHRTILLQGSDDQIVSLANSRTLWNGPPEQLQAVKEAGHWLLSPPLLAALQEQLCG